MRQLLSCSRQSRKNKFTEIPLNFADKTEGVGFLSFYVSGLNMIFWMPM
jgi:hypothetical protein